MSNDLDAAVKRLEEALLDLGEPEVTYALLPEVNEGNVKFNLYLDGSIVHTFTIRRTPARLEEKSLFYQNGEEYLSLENKDVEDFAQEFLKIIDGLDSYHRNVRAPLIEMYMVNKIGNPMLPLLSRIKEIAVIGEISFPELYNPSNEEEARLFLENILYLSRPEVEGKESVETMIIGIEHLSNIITSKGDRPISGIEVYQSGDSSAALLRKKLLDLTPTKDNI